MRTLAVLFALAAVGCDSSDPCAGRSGTCIALTVQGTATGLDALAVTVDQPTTKTETTPMRALSLPVTLGLHLPGSVDGAVDIDVAALAGGAVVAFGKATADVSHNRATATVTLGADIVGDMLGGDDSGPSSPDLPGAPTSVVASSGDAQAVVTWTAPANPGSSAITSYTVLTSPGGMAQTTDGSTTTATVTGLTNGTSYTFTVAATNGAGTGPSATSNSVTPTSTPMVPLAPTQVSAVADVDHGAHVAWTAADNRGSPLSGYAIAITGSSATPTSAGPTATSAVVTGLTPGMLYSFTVTASNAVGDSAASSPSNPIQAATKPDSAPTGVTATANLPGGATVSWTAPATNGSSAITKYTVTASPGGMKMSTANGTTTTLPFTGLTVGTAYTFTVFASNLIGDGVVSSPSAAVTVAGKADPPTSVKVCGSGGQLWVVFTPVAGASSYDIFYSTTSPATGGTKVNRAGSPVGIPVGSGTYYVAVEAVTAVGDGLPSADVTATVTGQLHDVLFVAEPSTPAVDIYDCYSNLPDGTSAPTRSLSTSIDASSNSPIAVDGVSQILLVSNGTSVGIWQSPGSVNGNPGADYTIMPPAGGHLTALTIDAAHQKLYAWETANQQIWWYSYTTAASLNGATATEYTQPFSPVGAMTVDAATGNLWYTQIPTSSSLGVFGGLYASQQFKWYFYVSGTGTSQWTSLLGAAFAPVTSGTIFLSNSQGIGWFSNYATHATGAVPMDGSINFGATALATGNSMLIAQASATSQVRAWSTSTLSGTGIKTVSSSHTHSTSNGGIFYVP
ncbi:MAG TPA: fibronectin type III domain-containing protein [Polyangia bacterium]